MKENTPKCRSAMYTQQLQYLPDSTLEKLVERIETKVKPDKYAAILHDADISEDGSSAAPHVHVMMTFANAPLP